MASSDRGFKANLLHPCSLLLTLLIMISHPQTMLTKTCLVIIKTVDVFLEIYSFGKFLWQKLHTTHCAVYFEAVATQWSHLPLLLSIILFFSLSLFFAISLFLMKNYCFCPINSNILLYFLTSLFFFFFFFFLAKHNKEILFDFIKGFVLRRNKLMRKENQLGIFSTVCTLEISTVSSKSYIISLFHQLNDWRGDSATIGRANKTCVAVVILIYRR